MIKEYEGKTEKEAIDKAVDDLKLEREKFDVEVLEELKRGVFRKGLVKIRVHVDEYNDVKEVLEIESDFEEKIVRYLEDLLSLMGFPGKINIVFREDQKTGLEIVSDYSGLIIGKRGKTLDALQLITNVYAGKLSSDTRIIIDTEGYRVRREENIVRLANKMADQVRRSKGSRLLEPMNPFERRIVHTTLNDIDDIDTKSEGDGMYRQVRVIYKGF